MQPLRTCQTEVETIVATRQRLPEIEESRHLGFTSKRLTLEQARRIHLMIDSRQLELSGKGKAALTCPQVSCQ